MRWELILKKLPAFDPSRDTKFLTYLHQFIYDTFKTFRMQQECWQVPSLDLYKTIRRMAAIYNANDQDKKKAIEIFCKDTGYTQKMAEAYLAEAIGIRTRQTEVIIDRNEDDVAVVEDITPDGKGSLHRIVCNHRRGLAIRESLGKLPWREREILEARNAICSNCGGMMPMKERFSFRDIGTRIMNGATDKGAEVAYHAALKQLMLQMIEHHPIRVVDLQLKKVVRRKKKNAAATYLYQADCDGEWGEIYIDFENKYIKIERLAEWDTTVSHVYAWKAIGFIVANRERMLVKKKRIIFSNDELDD